MGRGEAEGLNVKALALINPGNPTGQVLSREDLEVICRFCAKNGIVLLADEVYQRNVYADNKEFISTKKVALEDPQCENLQLVSFHSTSKGFIGECGRRGGFFELVSNGEEKESFMLCLNFISFITMTRNSNLQLHRSSVYVLLSTTLTLTSKVRFISSPRRVFAVVSLGRL